MHTDDAIYSEQYLSCSFFSSLSIQSDLKKVSFNSSQVRLLVSYSYTCWSSVTFVPWDFKYMHMPIQARASYEPDSEWIASFYGPGIDKRSSGSIAHSSAYWLQSKGVEWTGTFIIFTHDVVAITFTVWHILLVFRSPLFTTIDFAKVYSLATIIRRMWDVASAHLRIYLMGQQPSSLLTSFPPAISFHGNGVGW